MATTEGQSLLDLPLDAFAIVLAHLGVRPCTSVLCRLAEVCTATRASLSDDSLWLALCKLVWAWDADLSAEWPQLASFRSLYAVLETWAPRQGFHTLVDSFPWGCLLLCHFKQGRFVGELYYHSSAADGGDKCATHPPVTVLEVDFTRAEFISPITNGLDRLSFEGGGGLLPAWLQPAERPQMSWCGLSLASCTLVGASPDVHTSDLVAHSDCFSLDVPTSGFRFRHCLRLEMLGSRGPVTAVPTESETKELWEPRPRPDSDQEGDRWQRRLCGLGWLRGRVTLGLMDGPRLRPSRPVGPPRGDRVDTHAGQLELRDGLYVGDYSAHHGMYGQYGREALLLQKWHCDASDGDDYRALLVLLRLDGAEGAGPAAALLAELRGAGESSGTRRPCTLLVGRKVTGDFHVPMGAVTFVALLEPTRAGATPPPAQARTRSGWQPVRRGWPGLGTLAFPGFSRPSWDTGWLVQTDDDADGHRFAFVWASMQGQPANVLTQLVAQNTAYFLGGGTPSEHAYASA